MRTLMILLIKVYRFAVSPFMSAHCRFHPSCSCYAEQAFQRYGFMKATWLTVTRLARCHPWHAGGMDPLPDKVEK